MRQDCLPIPHFQLTFTLDDDSLSDLILANRRRLYNWLFDSAWWALSELAAKPQHLGGRTGAVMVLHTWNQRLGHHPHVHAVVPAGVLLPDGSWKATGTDYLLPVDQLSDQFRERFLDGLEQLYKRGELNLEGKLAPLADPHKFQALLAEVRKQAWVVNVQRPPKDHDDALALLKYVAAYMAGAAISDQRLISHDGQKVTFWVKQRQAQSIRKGKRPGNGEEDGPRRYPVEMDGFEFTCRFMMHILPKGFQRVRYRGLYHNSQRDTELAQVRRQLASAPENADRTDAQLQDAELQDAARDSSRPTICPACCWGRLETITELRPPWEVDLGVWPYRLLGRKRVELDLDDWTPVVYGDPPAPLRPPKRRLASPAPPSPDIQPPPHFRRRDRDTLCNKAA
jgi:hypothetical protein